MVVVTAGSSSSSSDLQAQPEHRGHITAHNSAHSNDKK